MNVSLKPWIRYVGTEVDVTHITHSLQLLLSINIHNQSNCENSVFLINIGVAVVYCYNYSSNEVATLTNLPDISNDNDNHR